MSGFHYLIHYRLCILSLGRLYGALQIWFYVYVMLCYLEHGWRYKHSIDEAPIGNGTSGNGYVSNDVMWPYRSRSWSRYIWMPICWRLLKIALDRLCVLFNIAMFLQYLHFHQPPFSPFLLPWGQIFVQPWSTATAALAGMFHSWTFSRCWSIVWLMRWFVDVAPGGVCASKPVSVPWDGAELEGWE